MIKQILNNIFNKNNKKILNHLSGNILSDKLGGNGDFHALKEYQYGDKSSNINWKISSKLQKTFINVFKDEKKINIIIGVILNGSTDFGEPKTKKILMSEIYDLIGKFFLKDKNLFETIIFSDALLLYSKHSNLSSLDKNKNFIKKFNPIGKKANYNNFVSILMNRAKKNSLIYIISDFIGDIDLKKLALRNEIISIIVRDKLEENPLLLKNIKFCNMENNFEEPQYITEDNISDYIYELKKNDAKLLSTLKINKINYMKIFTDDNISKKFLYAE